MDEEKWIKDIRKKMADYETPPPTELWSSIEKELNKPLPNSTVPKKEHAIHPFRLWKAVSAAAVILIAVLFCHKYISSIHESDHSMPTNYVAQQSIKPHKTNETKTILKTISNSTFHSQKAIASLDESLTQGVDTYNHSNAISTNSDEGSTKSVVPGDKDTQESDIDDKETPSIENKTPNNTNAEVHHKKSDPRQLYNKDFMPSHSKSQTGRIALTASISNLPNSSNNKMGYDELVMGSLWPGNSDAPNKEYGTMEDILIANQGNVIYTKKKHKQPIKVGLGISIPLTKRIYLNTGISYSYLSSELISGTNSNHYTTHQSLHYLGIPINVGYTFWQNKSWKIYASGGGTVEKCVAGNSVTDFHLDGKTEKTTRETVYEKQLQLSLQAAAGMGYNISSSISLYIEPGLNYHFDNHSPVSNIYKDTPLNFSLEGGVRFSF